MIKQPLGKSFIVSLLILLLPVVISAQGVVGHTAKKDTKGKLRVVVTGGEESRPVSGADLLVRWQTGTKLFEETTKTDSHGVANIASVRPGSILIQITAAGWRTSGGQYVLSGNGMSISVRLEKDGPHAGPAPAPLPQRTLASFVAPLRKVRALAASVKRPKTRSRSSRKNH